MKRIYKDKHGTAIYRGSTIKVSDIEARIVEVDGDLRMMTSDYKVSHSLDALDRFDIEVQE